MRDWAAFRTEVREEGGAGLRLLGRGGRKLAKGGKSAGPKDHQAEGRWLSLFFFSPPFLSHFPKRFQIENEFKFWKSN